MKVVESKFGGTIIKIEKLDYEENRQVNDYFNTYKNKFREIKQLTLFTKFIDKVYTILKTSRGINFWCSYYSNTIGKKYNYQNIIQMITQLPVNTKSLISHIFGVMQALANGEIDCNHAVAQAKLASQACNLLNYELKRTIVELKLKETGGAIKTPVLREIESKPFTNTMEYCDESTHTLTDENDRVQ